MKMSVCRKVVALVMVLFTLFCWGCGSKQARYYMLSSAHGLAPVSADGRTITVGVGPVHLPDYLMRPEIVTRPDGSRVKVGEFDRWAEPLDETMLRVLIEDLSGMFPGASFLSHPWNRATPIDYRISVDVISFEQQPDGKVLLGAVWKLQDGDGRAVRTERTSLTAQVDGEGYGPIVSAMNKAMAQLSEEIARALPD